MHRMLLVWNRVFTASERVPANSECVVATSTALSCCGSHTSADKEVVVDTVEPAAADGERMARTRTTGAAHAPRAAAVRLCAVSMECRVAI